MTSPHVTNSEYQTICTWMGRNIEELSKEELVDVVKQLGRNLEEERKRHMGTLDMWAAFRRAGAQ